MKDTIKGKIILWLLNILNLFLRHWIWIWIPNTDPENFWIWLRNTDINITASKLFCKSVYFAWETAVLAGEFSVGLRFVKVARYVSCDHRPEVSLMVLDFTIYVFSSSCNSLVLCLMTWTAVHRNCKNLVIHR